MVSLCRDQPYTIPVNARVFISTAPVKFHSVRRRKQQNLGKSGMGCWWMVCAPSTARGPANATSAPQTGVTAAKLAKLVASAPRFLCLLGARQARSCSVDSRRRDPESRLHYTEFGVVESTVTGKKKDNIRQVRTGPPIGTVVSCPRLYSSSLVQCEGQVSQLSHWSRVDDKWRTGVEIDEDWRKGRNLEKGREGKRG